MGAVVQPSLFAFLFTLLYYPTVAQYSWSEINVGLYGASVRCFVSADGGRLFAATNGGVYVRSRGAVSWRRSVVGDDASALCALPYGVVIAGFGSSIIRTADAGETWTKVSTGLHVRSFGRISDVAVVAAGSPWGAGVPQTVVRRSTDNGLTWSTIEIAPLLTDDVSFAEGTGGRCFAGTAQGIFSSDDDGATWNATSFPNVVRDLVVIDGSVVAATNQGMFQTTDNGQSWRAVDTLPAQMLSVDGGVIYGVVGAGPESGLYRTSALGSAWERLTAIVPRAVETSSDGDLWLAVGTTPLRSPDRGRSWFDGSVGLTSADVSEVLAVGDVAVASVRGALYRFIPIDGRWELLQNAPQLRLLARGNQRQDGLVPMIGVSREPSSNPSFAYDDVIYRSVDYGETWEAVGRGGHMTLPVCEGSSLGVVGHARHQGSRVASGGLLVTRNGGATWDSAALDVAVSSVALRNGILHAAVIGMDDQRPVDLGLYRSSDSGVTWNRRVSGVAIHELAALDDGRLLAVISRPELRQGDTVLGRNELSIVDDDVVTTVLVDTIPISIQLVLPKMILIDAVLPNAHIVTLRSSDNGSSWHTVRAGDSEYGRLAPVAGTIEAGLVGILDGSPYGSTDGGITWSSMGSGLLRRNASSIAHRQSRSFVVGTNGDGAYTSADLMATPSVDKVSGHPWISLRLHGRQLQIDTEHPTDVVLDVVDIQGRSLFTLLQRLRVDRTILLPFYDQSLAHGLYFIRARGPAGAMSIPVIAGQ